MSCKKMITRVEYKFNGKKDVLYYGGLTTKEDQIRRTEKMGRLGFEILNISEIEHI